MSNRLKIRFPSEEAMQAAQAMEMPGAEVVVANSRRHFVSVSIPDAPETRSAREMVAIGVEMAPSLRLMAERYGAELVEDYQYSLERPEEHFSFDGVEEMASGSLDDVSRMIDAVGAWEQARGAGAVIAVVDTGIDGTHPEFPDSKKVGHWEPPGDQAWTDWEGHGTMCATIAAASDSTPGSRYRGVAPDAGLIACKTQFYDSELATIYDFLSDQAAALDRPLVATNSFGQRTGTAPPVPVHSDFIPALDDAIAAGVIVFFSAGNNHELAGGTPAACSPTTVWLHKSRADVFVVATCDLDRAMWFYSSRGPGQHFGDPGTGRKPDVTAPTPRNGRILYGPNERVLPNGWGTSGACPQVAGLAALLVGNRPNLDRAAVFELIRSQAVSLGHEQECEGAGLITCGATVRQLQTAPALA